ncbi:MAG: hypothetical protein NC305_12025 [Lachnospiraceae bacterium]|nr:hypothetical protein [Butyrivibrio sp.]MCM1343572.1 hypothetical protein [Muribaculaceae bacterium]MCM1411259.1 hypothetical protein [Lachnospiraceae bacterium]
MEEQNKIEIPEVVYQGDDKKLKERVSKFKEGSFRIAVFTIVGLIMGAYSHKYIYTGVGFPVKLILAVPYKISEAIYVSVIGTDAASMMHVGSSRWYWIFTEYFPHSSVATFLAEVVTTILVGGAVYGALAYFTGDKRVFTMQRFLKFGAVWCGIILLTVGAAYLVNAKAIYDNENLRGEPRFVVHTSKERGKSITGSAEQLAAESFRSELGERDIIRDYEEELILEIVFNDTRMCLCQVNCEKQYVVTEQGRTYHISAEFAQIVRQYAEELIPEAQDGERAESVEVMGGKVQ